jgi:hypothetical protein
LPPFVSFLGHQPQTPNGPRLMAFLCRKLPFEDSQGKKRQNLAFQNRFN